MKIPIKILSSIPEKKEKRNHNWYLIEKEDFWEGKKTTTSPTTTHLTHIKRWLYTSTINGHIYTRREREWVCTFIRLFFSFVIIYCTEKSKAVNQPNFVLIHTAALQTLNKFFFFFQVKRKKEHTYNMKVILVSFLWPFISFPFSPLFGSRVSNHKLTKELCCEH